MIIPVTALVLLLSVRLLGGRLSRLADVRLRLLPLVPLALLLQLALTAFPLPARFPSGAVHVASYLLAAVFIAANIRVPGLLLLAVGSTSNGITIALNGGVLPASADALARAGLSGSRNTFVNSGVVEHPRLAFLGDVFAIPAGFPLANVFSAGDVLIVLGVGYAAYRICGTRWWGPWDPSRHGHATRSRGRHRADGRPPAAPVPPEPLPAIPAPAAPATPAPAAPATPAPAQVPMPVATGTDDVRELIPMFPPPAAPGTGSSLPEPATRSTAVATVDVRSRARIPWPRRSRPDDAATDRPADDERPTEATEERNPLPVHPVALTITPGKGRLGPRFRAR